MGDKQNVAQADVENREESNECTFYDLFFFAFTVTAVSVSIVT